MHLSNSIPPFGTVTRGICTRVTGPEEAGLINSYKGVLINSTVLRGSEHGWQDQKKQMKEWQEQQKMFSMASKKMYEMSMDYYKKHPEAAKGLPMVSALIN